MCMFRNGIKFAWLVFADMACLFAATRHVLSEADSRNQRNAVAILCTFSRRLHKSSGQPNACLYFRAFSIVFPACLVVFKQRGLSCRHHVLAAKTFHCNRLALCKWLWAKHGERHHFATRRHAWHSLWPLRVPPLCLCNLAQRMVGGPK